MVYNPQLAPWLRQLGLIAQKFHRGFVSRGELLDIDRRVDVDGFREQRRHDFAERRRVFVGAAAQGDRANLVPGIAQVFEERLTKARARAGPSAAISAITRYETAVPFVTFDDRGFAHGLARYCRNWRWPIVRFPVSGGFRIFPVRYSHARALSRYIQVSGNQRKPVETPVFCFGLGEIIFG